MTDRASSSWTGQQERSHLAVVRFMVWLSLTFGRPLGRLVLHGIALYFTLFAPKARAASRAYLQRVLGRRPGWRDVYRHVFSFSSTIHDRIYLLNDRFDLFDIEVTGADAVAQALARQPGAILFGAHLGSFEVLRAMGRDRAGLQVSMLMYEDNARKINAALEAINPAARQDIVPLGRMDSMLRAHERLQAGSVVGMLVDRSIGADATVDCTLLGETAALPLGPWRMAAALRRPVFFMAGLYLGGNRYAVRLEPVADFSDTPRGEVDAAIRCAMQRYADRLSQMCRQSPYNWFNFFDFWQKK